MQTIRNHILHNDHHIVVVNKPSGQIVSSGREGDTSVQQMIEAYVKRNVFVVHRLDTPVSGILIFAKNKKAAGTLGDDFKNRNIEKTYLAVSRYKGEEEEGEWKDDLTKMNVQNKSFVGNEGKGKNAETSFKWRESLDHLHLWELTPKTGRHHQLRVQMAQHIGPVRGDRKYGDKRGNKDGSIDLHAWTLKFKHPSTGQEMKFVAPVPERPPWQFFKSINDDTDV